MNQTIEEVRNALQVASDEKVRESAARFFKEDVFVYGVKSSIVHQISKAFFKQIKGLSKARIFDLCEELWQSGIMEEAIVACDWTYAIRKQFALDDFNRFEEWVNSYVTNWAACDTFCNHTMGALVEKYPTLLVELKKWVLSPNRWVRRGAAVSLIVPAKKGLFIADIFDIANALLHDQDDMVQKGYGWMLKVSCQQYQLEVFDFVMQNKGTMPRTALRYAIEKMPQELKSRAMLK